MYRVWFKLSASGVCGLYGTVAANLGHKYSSEVQNLRCAEGESIKPHVRAWSHIDYTAAPSPCDPAIRASLLASATSTFAVSSPNLPPDIATARPPLPLPSLTCSEGSRENNTAKKGRGESVAVAAKRLTALFFVVREKYFPIPNFRKIPKW